MTESEVLTLLVALVAVVIAATSLVRSRRVAQEQLELQRTLASLAKKQLEIILREEKSSASARIAVRFEKEVGKTDRLVLENVGTAAAKNLTFVLKPHGSGDSPLVEQDVAQKFPVPVLAPGSYVKVLAAFHMGSATAFDVELHWVNPSGELMSDQTFIST